MQALCIRFLERIAFIPYSLSKVHASHNPATGASNSTCVKGHSARTNTYATVAPRILKGFATVKTLAVTVERTYNPESCPEESLNLIVW